MASSFPAAKVAKTAKGSAHPAIKATFGNAAPKAKSAPRAPGTNTKGNAHSGMAGKGGAYRGGSK